MTSSLSVSERIQQRIRVALGSDDAFASDIANLRDKLSSEFDAELRIHESQTRVSRQEVITGAIKAVVASEQVESSIDSRIAGRLRRQADLEVPLPTALNIVERVCALHFILLAVNQGKPDHHALSSDRIRKVLDRLVDEEEVCIARRRNSSGESEEILQRGSCWPWWKKILRYVVGLDKEGKIQVAGLFLRALGLLATIGIAVWLGPSSAVCDFPVVSAMGRCQTPINTPVGGLIAFESDLDGNYNIYVMNADGSAKRRLTSDKHDDRHPSLSPDGRLIAFASNRDGNFNIYVMNADGSDQKRRTDSQETDWYPSWSTQSGGGHYIAFASNRDGDFNIYRMNADGLGQTRLTPDDPVDYSDPSWSSDGSIAFVGVRDGNPNIYELSDSVLTGPLLTNYAQSPTWSPDGRRIAFASHSGRSWDIYLMNADGSGKERLTKDDSANEYQPSWSPNGRRIAFVQDSGKGKHNVIYTMNADDGSDLRLLTDNDQSNYRPSWSP